MPAVTLIVNDTGCGMTEAEQSHMFEPFYTTKSQGKGTGLGLAVVHGVVKQGGGQIEVQSAVNRGTRFKIFFPVAGQPGSPEMNAATPKNIQGGTETLLLVEDEQVVREIAEQALESAGYTVLAAANDEEAIAIAQGHSGKIDLLVTDVVLPQMNGRQLADALRNRHPHLKVLFISGYAPDLVLRRGVLEGEVDFLEKPFTPMLLGSKIRAVLDGI
jgi:CheY-like chemotaxis protein